MTQGSSGVTFQAPPRESSRLMQNAFAPAAFDTPNAQFGSFSPNRPASLPQDLRTVRSVAGDGSDHYGPIHNGFVSPGYPPNNGLGSAYGGSVSDTLIG